MRAHVLPLLALLGLLAGCEDDNTLEGSWVRKQFPNNRPCAEELIIGGGNVVSTILCDLADKQVGTQITAGTYRQADNRLFVKPVRSTCPAWPTDVVTWTVSHTREVLQRTMDTVTNTFDRGGLDVSANRIKGCFDAELKEFDEGPLLEL